MIHCTQIFLFYQFLISLAPGSSQAGAVDEESFMGAFEEVKRVNIYSGRALAEELGKIRETLSKSSNDWKVSINKSLVKTIKSKIYFPSGPDRGAADAALAAPGRRRQLRRDVQRPQNARCAIPGEFPLIKLFWLWRALYKMALPIYEFRNILDCPYKGSYNESHDFFLSGHSFGICL